MNEATEILCTLLEAGPLDELGTISKECLAALDALYPHGTPMRKAVLGAVYGVPYLQHAVALTLRLEALLAEQARQRIPIDWRDRNIQMSPEPPRCATCGMPDGATHRQDCEFIRRRHNRELAALVQKSQIIGNS